MGGYHWADGPLAQVVEPTESRKLNGWAPRERPAAEHMNWLIQHAGCYQRFATVEDLIAADVDRGLVLASGVAPWERVWSAGLAANVEQIQSDAEFLWIKYNVGGVDTAIIKHSRINLAVVGTISLAGMASDHVWFATAGGHVYVVVEYGGPGGEWRIAAYDRTTLAELYHWTGAFPPINPVFRVIGLATDGRFIAEARVNGTGGSDINLYEDDGTAITAVENRQHGVGTQAALLAMDGHRLVWAGAAGDDGAHIHQATYRDGVFDTVIRTYTHGAEVTSMAFCDGAIVIGDANPAGGARDRLVCLGADSPSAATLSSRWGMDLNVHALAGDVRSCYVVQDEGVDIGETSARSWIDGTPIGWIRNHGAAISIMIADHDALFTFGILHGGVRIRRHCIRLGEARFVVHGRTDRHRTLPTMIEEA